MAEFKIEKGVPFPAALANTRKYPLHEMEPGDSLFIPNKTTSAISGSLIHARRTLGREFVSRTVEGGVRVWRTK